MGSALRRYRADLIVVLGVLLALVVASFLHRGVPAAEVRLNDGGVWVVNSRLRLVAHLNYQSRVLDGGLRAGSDRFDLAQSANDVVVDDLATSQLQGVNTATVSLDGQLPLTDGLEYSFGGGRVGIASPSDGKVWVVAADQLGSFSAGADPAVGELPGVRVVTGVDGTTHAITPEGVMKTLAGDPDAVQIKDAGRLDRPLPSGAHLSVVGATVVALDAAANVLITPRATFDLPPGGVLQQAGPDAAAALVATGDALLSLPVAGGTPTSTPAPAAGTPVAPVHVDGCSYAAWSGSGGYLRQCAGLPDVGETVAALASSGDLAFRVNRSVVVLNNTDNGNVYLVNEGMAVVDNWDVIENQQQQQEREDDAEVDEFSDEVTPKDPSSQTPPVAEPDEFGVRAGTSTTLPVLINDTDADGDVLTAVIDQADGPFPVHANRNGRSLRVDVPGNATGTMRFTYKAFDGEDESSPAAVTVRVRSAGTNEAPQQKRRPTITLVERSQATYSVLPDWVDPDGDQIFLESASADEGLQVNFRQDGTLSVRDLGTAGPGLREVTTTVADGTSTEQGVIRVQVRPAANLPPVANADFYSTRVNESVVVSPLRNDTDPNGDRLVLTGVDPAGDDLQIVPDFGAGTFTFTASAPGSHEVGYSVSDGPIPVRGKVRIDVIDPAGSNAPPVAENDLALLSPNSSVMVGVLDNDTDPLGGVLVVQGVNLPSDTPLSVEVINRATVRVSAPVGLKAPASFSYVVSNGSGTAAGAVLVLPLQASATNRPPVAVADEAIVRAGDIVTVPVLANDYSPSSMELALEPALEVHSEKPVGEAFVAGDTIRFRAADAAGTARVTYTARDVAGNVASAELRVTVIPFEQANQLPRPIPLVGRTVAGGQAKIPVTLDGVDPDGDYVQIEGVGTAPRMGTVTVERGFLLYTASESAAGTDSFTYKVADQFGGVAEAQVRVGVAAAPTTNQAPVAVTDTRWVRPNRTVAVAVTENDLDPDGDRVSLVAGSVTPVDASTTAPVTLVGQKVEVQTPGEASTLQYYYDIVDGNGGRARGVLIIKVDASVPLVPPVAVDDSLTAQDLAGLAEFAVDVLTNDADPDGSVTALTLTADAPARVQGDKVVVTQASERQMLLYTITDPDGLSSRAAVVVPGSDRTPPTLRPEKLPAKVKGGEELVIGLGDYVLTRPNHEAILTSAQKVAAGPGGEGAPVVRDEKTVSFTPDPMFVGPTSVSFEVTDGTSVEDPRGLKATLIVPIEVESSGLFPPQVRPSEITMSPGEDPAPTDLRSMVTDPDPGDLEKMQFSLVGASSGFEARIDGGQIFVSAQTDLRPGATGTATVRVTDGTTEPVEMVLPLTVIASTRPLIQTTDVTINEARSGEPTVVDLTSSITNPFADKGEPVTLVGTPTVASGVGSASADGLQVTVTPDASFNGQMVVTYQVLDATKDPSRQRPGTIRLTVKGLPDAPTNVFAETKASRSATVQWTAGDLRGGTLSGFTVSWSGGSKDCGRQTVCELAGMLQNDVEYTFTVTQSTEVGESSASAPSNVVRPDVKPNPPSVPVATFGDQQIQLAWSDGGGDGSATSSYTLEVSPAVGGRTQVADIAGTSYTMTGLTNGTPYTFKVRAHNKAPDPSDFSGPSAPTVPAGAPSGQGAPQVLKDAVSSALPRASVRWSPPANPNGDSSFTYQLRRTGTGTVLYEGTATETTVNLDVSTQDQTFEVQATNKSQKWSGWSGPSNAVRGFQTPGAPSGFSAEPTGQNNSVRFSFGAAEGNGASASEIRYVWSASGASGTVSSGQTVANGVFRNGVDVVVQLRAISTVRGESAEGPAVSATVNAYGPPVAPSISCSGEWHAVNCSWSGGSGNGRGVSYSLSGAAGGAVGSPGSWGSGDSGDIGPSAGRSLCVIARQDGSGATAQNCASNTSWEAHSATLWQRGTTTSAGWFQYDIQLRRYRPGSSVTCYVAGIGAAAWNQTFGVDGAGNGNYQTVYVQAANENPVSATNECRQN